VKYSCFFALLLAIVCPAAASPAPGEAGKIDVQELVRQTVINEDTNYKKFRVEHRILPVGSVP
jgi:hypothetical protein